MSFRCTILLFLSLLFTVQAGFAQKKKNKGKRGNRDHTDMEATEIQYISLGTGTLFTMDDLERSLNGNREKPDLGAAKKAASDNKPPVVSEETSSLEEGTVHLVQVSDELKIDCVWVTSHDYYSVWDSYNVNPYHTDGTEFSDTVLLTLYDTVNNLSWSPPIHSTKVNSDFGMRHYRWHYGIDLDLEKGDTVKAAFDGIVRIAKYDRAGYGYYVMLRHKNGLETLYGHLSEYIVTVGQEVKAGEPVGWGGSTGRSSGAHLHFEVRYLGVPIDPVTLYDFKANMLVANTLEVTPRNFQYLKDARKVIYHKIRRGDTLSEISERYGVPISTICRFNGINRKTILRLGQRLRVR